MIFSNEDLYCFAQAITADAASTNVIDHGAAGTVYKAASAITIDRGKGNVTPPLLIQVVETFDALTSMKVLFQTDDNSAFSSAKTVWQSTDIVLADLVAGYKVNLTGIPEQTSERYSRIYFDITGTGPSVGKMTAGFVLARQTNSNA